VPLVSPRYRDRDFLLRRLLLLADLGGVTLALVVALTLAGYRGQPWLDALWIALTLPGWALLFRVYGLYERQMRRFEPTRIDDLLPLLHALMVGTLALWASYKLLPVPRLILEEILIFALAAMALIVALRTVVRGLHLRIRGPERVLVFSDPQVAEMIGRKLANHPEFHMRLQGAILTGRQNGGSPEAPPPPRIDQLEQMIIAHRVDHLVLQLGSALPAERVGELLQMCHRANIRVSAIPQPWGLLRSGVEVNFIEGLGFLSYQPPVLTRSSWLLKRGFDLVFGCLLLLLLAPLMVVIAIAIKLDSPGSILFRQTRVGRNGKRFRLVKFRTMVADADRRTAELMEASRDPDWLLITDDPRVTWVGRLLRSTSLDELPQLWNVLKGEMSLVGPRPLSERDDEGVTGWGRHRLDLVPGLTGPWQVMGRTRISFREMVDLDYDYVTNWSLPRDLKVLLQTVPAVIRRRGAN
jgi:exopolysaccharide biosynthesis polyprenyl glycosylphosphotransferase